MKNKTHRKVKFEKTERCRYDDQRRDRAVKERKDAVILAHYYVRPEIQEIADYIGDSFYLSKVAVGLKEKTIVFCGVSFMGESAKILNSGKDGSDARYGSRLPDGTYGIP